MRRREFLLTDTSAVLRNGDGVRSVERKSPSAESQFLTEGKTSMVTFAVPALTNLSRFRVRWVRVPLRALGATFVRAQAPGISKEQRHSKTLSSNLWWVTSFSPSVDYLHATGR